MKALLINGSKRIPVTVEETSEGGFIIWPENHNTPLILKPLEEARPIHPQPQQDWVFSGNDDLPENIEPQDHPQITMRDLLPGTPENNAYNWRLIVHRFPWLFAKDFEYKQAAKYAEQIHTGKVANEAPVIAKSQLDIDLEIIWSHLREIIQDGQFVYGHQSIIAGLLGGSNQGGFRRNRVLPVEASLSKFITSATSTNGPAPGRNGDFDQARQAGSK